MGTIITSAYGSSVAVQEDLTYTTVADFDKLFLYPKKLA